MENKALLYRIYTNNGGRVVYLRSLKDIDGIYENTVESRYIRVGSTGVEGFPTLKSLEK